MKKQLTYRKASLADFDQLKALGKQSYAEFAEVLTAANWAKMSSFLESDETLTQLIKRSTVFVCEEEFKLVGMIYLMPSGNPTELFDAAWSYIRFLGVSTNYRGKGIGAKLTELCLAQAKTQQERYVALHTSEFMGAARTIYEKRGFKAVKEIAYLGKRYWIYLLELE